MVEDKRQYREHLVEHPVEHPGHAYAFVHIAQTRNEGLSSLTFSQRHKSHKNFNLRLVFVAFSFKQSLNSNCGVVNSRISMKTNV